MCRRSTHGERRNPEPRRGRRTGPDAEPGSREAQLRFEALVSELLIEIVARLEDAVDASSTSPPCRSTLVVKDASGDMPSSMPPSDNDSS